MSDLTFGVRETAGIVRNFYAADAVAVEAMKGTTRRSLKRAYRIAQDHCPVKFGFLKRNMHPRLTDDDLFWELFWDASDFEEAGLPFYAPPVEFGTYRTPAQPSITVAQFEEGPRYEREIGRDVRQALERMRVP